MYKNQKRRIVMSKKDDVIPAILPEVIEIPDKPFRIMSFPDGFRFYAHTAVEEAALIHRELIQEMCYLQHGVKVSPGNTIFDVGGNMGLFSVALSMRFTNLTIHAFEPIPASCEVFRANMDLFQLKGVNLHEFGLGDGTEEESEINFYPNLTGNSTRHPETKALVRKFAEENYPPEMVENFFSFEKVKIKLRRLSDVLKDLGEPPIDLLKIDVEGDELPVLMGINPEHWTLIHQLVLEVHNAADNLENILSYINKADSGLILTAGEIDSLDTALIWGHH